MAELKKPTTYREQLEILRARNVIVEDEPRCLDVLASINYYRFAAYFLPFKQDDDLYFPGTQFWRVYRIYEFDRKLRSILFSALEEVETSLRARFAYYHAHQYGALGYMDPQCFSERHRPDKFKDNFDREVEYNKRSLMVAHHMQRYGGKFPIWVAVELFTFGMLSHFYEDMKTSDQKRLAKELYCSIPKNIISWLRCCTDLRNICAHYGRLYYRIFTAMPAGVTAHDRQLRRLWGAICALKSLYPDTSRWNDEVLVRIQALFDEYTEDICLAHIGFPEDWETQLYK